MGHDPNRKHRFRLRLGKHLRRPHPRHGPPPRRLRPLLHRLPPRPRQWFHRRPLRSLHVRARIIVTIVVMATDFTSFAIIKDHVNKDDTGSTAHYSTGMWTCLAAMVCLFLATFVVLFTCCSSRMHKKRESRAGHVEKGYVANGTHTRTKRHFWQRKSRTTTTARTRCLLLFQKKHEVVMSCHGMSR